MEKSDNQSGCSVIFLPHLPQVVISSAVQALGLAFDVKTDHLLQIEGSEEYSANYLESDLIKEKATTSCTTALVADEDLKISLESALCNSDPRCVIVLYKTSVTELLLSLCRTAGLFPPRATLLTVAEQQQALLLCLAKKNKDSSGEFCVVASDLLDAWNAIIKSTFSSNDSQEDYNNSCEDPVKSNMAELLASYSSFVKSCNNVDLFSLHAAFSKLIQQSGEALVEVLHSKLVVVEGVLSPLEWQLLSPLLQSRHVATYVAAVEQTPGHLDFSKSVDFDLNLSGFDGLSDRVNESQLLTDSVTSFDDVTFLVGEKRYKLCLSNVKETPITWESIESRLLSWFEDGISTSRTCFKTPIVKKAPDLCTTPVIRRLPVKAFSPRMSAAGSAESGSETGVHTPASVHVKTRASARHIESTGKAARGRACFQYVQQVMVSQVRLLLNTRDELALAINCSLPGTELSHEAFTDIKKETQRRGMPMFQTILSVIVKLRLGGSGYQADASCPILNHVKPLSAFVDHMNQLTNILEDNSDASAAAAKILQRVRRYIVQQCSGIYSQDCALKPTTVEAVHSALQAKLDQCKRELLRSTDSVVKVGAVKLPPALTLLLRLCDKCASECGTKGESVLSLVSDDLNASGLLLSQGSPRTAHTPLRIPSMLSLFRTPPPADSSTPLRVRLMRGKGSKPSIPHRYRSCLAWAPENLSPVQMCESPAGEPGPVLGPTLIAAAPASRRSSQYWQEVIAEVTGDTKEGEHGGLVRGGSTTGVASNEKAASAAATAVVPANSMPGHAKADKRSIKRSLLNDISNLAAKEKDSNNKRRKTVTTAPSLSKKRTNTKPTSKQQPSNQKSIMSYFKAS